MMSCRPVDDVLDQDSWKALTGHAVAMPRSLPAAQCHGKRLCRIRGLTVRGLLGGGGWETQLRTTWNSTWNSSNPSTIYICYHLAGAGNLGKVAGQVPVIAWGIRKEIPRKRDGGSGRGCCWPVFSIVWPLQF